MIKVKYYASAKDAGDYELYGVDYDEYGMYFIDNVQDEVKEIKDIFNYANFFEDGIALNDASVQLGDENDYYGWLIFESETDGIVWADFRGSASPADLENGIDITFNKYTCKRIEVYFDNGSSVTMIGETNDENGLPEKVHIDLDSNIDYSELAQVKIAFSDPTIDGDPINVKGIYFGNLIEIENVFDFDMISETNPISDDLSINEMNVSAYIDEDFVGRGGQVVEIYDKGQLLESDILKSIKEIDLDFYEMTTQSKLLQTDKIKLYPFATEIVLEDESNPNGWSWENVFTIRDIVNQLKSQAGVDVYVPDIILDNYVDPFCFGNEATNARKILQQIAWATACRIDTSHSDKIMLDPVLAEERAEPDIVINNDDDRILTTNIDAGELYSKILWKIPAFVRSSQVVRIGETDLIWNDGSGEYEGIFVSDKPFYAYQSGRNVSYTMLSPYSVKISLFSESGKAEETEPIAITGCLYEETEKLVEIDTGIKNAGTLEISNQPMFLDNFIDTKSNQLQKWYSKNNTLSATVVDDNSEIRVGKVIKIQLKKGNYFQGIITKVVRNSINDYHTVELEAHEWN